MEVGTQYSASVQKAKKSGDWSNVGRGIKLSWFKGSETTSSSGTISGARNVHNTNSYDRGKHTSNVIKRVDASQVGGGTGPRYYSGSGTSRSSSLASTKAGMNALRTMVSAPQDSVRAVDLPKGVK